MSVGKEMLILVMDTAQQGAIVALADTERGIMVQRESEAMYGQGDILIPMIEDILRECGITYQDLNIIGVTKGPGAFTGLRIGLSAARGFRLALEGVRVLGISSFEALLHSAQNASGLVAVLIETKRPEYYVCLFEDQKLIELGIFNTQDLRERLQGKAIRLIGDAVVRFMQETGTDYEIEEILRPSAEALAMLAERSMNMDLTPIYMRPADVTMPKKLPV